MYGLQDNYIESQILSADPLRLVQLLYRGAVDAVRAARTAIQRGDIAGRSTQITKASAILNELALSLDHSKGSEISRTLVELYDYMQRRLNESNFEQVEPPLSEVESLLITLLEGWQSIPAAERPESSPVNAYPAAAVGTDYQAFSYSY